MAQQVVSMGAVGSILSRPANGQWDSVVSVEPNSALGSQKGSLPLLRSGVNKVATQVPLLRKGGGYKKIGKPYEIRGVRYVPRHEPDYEEAGLASWYGDDFHGKKTANGEIYDMHALTAAHRTLPLPSIVRVENVKNGKSVLVRVNDRGPFMKGRIIDVSAKVAKLLDFADHGIAPVRVKYVGPAPLDGDDTQEREHLAALSQ